MTSNPTGGHSRLAATLLALTAGLLFVTPAAADTRKLNGTLLNGSVSQFAVSPDGATAIYLAQQDVQGSVELYSVATKTGSALKLNRSLVSGGQVLDFAITADGRRVVYRAVQDRKDTSELYSVPISGPAAAGIKLNGPLSQSEKVKAFWLSPDGRRVAYLLVKGDGDEQVQTAFLTVSLDDPGIQSTLLTERGVSLDPSPTFSPNGQRLVFHEGLRRDGVFTGEGLSRSPFSLYSVPAGGPARAAVQLHPQDVSPSKGHLAISANSERVVFTVQEGSDQYRQDLYSVPLGGPEGARVQLDVSVVWFVISPDSKRIIYVARDGSSTQRELFSVPIEGPASAGVKLNRQLPGGADVFTFRVSPDSQRVVYVADQDTIRVRELYSVPLNGPASAGLKLNPPLLVAYAGVDFFSLEISPDSSRVVYLASQGSSALFDLYSVPLAGPATSATKLTRPIEDGQVLDFQLSPSDGRAVFRNKRGELYSVPLAGPAGAASKIGASNTSAILVPRDAYQIAPDGLKVAYLADEQNRRVFELFVGSFEVSSRLLGSSVSSANARSTK